MGHCITTHHDGHGLNDLMRIYSDEPDKSGAAHHFRVAFDVTGTLRAIESGCTGQADETVAEIQFQKGPRHENDSTPGITEAVLLVILIERLEGFQSGPYACSENAEQLAHLRAALAATRARADARAARGVLGRNIA